MDPQAFKAADRGKHAYPDSGLQVYPRQRASNLLEGGTSLYHLRFSGEKIMHNTVGLLLLAKNALTYWCFENSHYTGIPDSRCENAPIQ